jgi:hypothetical protein
MINLIPLTENFVIYQLKNGNKIPSPILNSNFYSITKTSDEISIVTDYVTRIENLKSNTDWKCFKVAGILDFSAVGIINEITEPLKNNKISVFVISTFNTDYIFVKKEHFYKTIEIFKKMDNIHIDV